MSLSGLLSKCALRQGLRTFRAVSTEARTVPVVSKSTSCLARLRLSGSNPAAVGSYGYPSPAAQSLLGKRFYSGEGLVKSRGEMRVAIIGQSMFGQEVSGLLLTSVKSRSVC